MDELDSLLEERELTRELSLIRYSDSFFFKHSDLDELILELANREEALVALHEAALRSRRDSEKYYRKAPELKALLESEIDKQKRPDDLKRFYSLILIEHEALEMYRDSVHIKLWLQAVERLKDGMEGGAGKDSARLYYENSNLVGEAVIEEERLRGRAEVGYNNYLELINELEEKVEENEQYLVTKVTNKTALMHRITLAVLLITLFGLFLNRNFIRTKLITPLSELDRSITLLADKGKAEPLRADYGGELDKLVLSFNRLARKLKERYNLAVSRDDERYSVLEKSNKELRKVDLFKTNLMKTITTDLKGPLAAIIDLSKGSKEDNIYSFALKLKVNIDRLLEIVKINTGSLKPALKTRYIDVFLLNLLASYKELFEKLKLQTRYLSPGESNIVLTTEYDKLEQIVDNILYYIIKLDCFEDNNELKVGLINSEKTVTLEFIIEDIDFPEGEIIKILVAIGDLKSSVVDFSCELDLGILYVNELLNYMGGNFVVGNVSQNRGLKMAVTVKKGESSTQVETAEREYIAGKEEQRRDLHSVLHMELAGMELVKQLSALDPDESIANPEDIKDASILVVDDDHYILLLMDTYLKSAGYQNIHTVKNGREALELLDSTRVDMILCDVSMPFINGRELLERVVESDRFKNIPFVFVSALIEREIVLELKKKGAVDYLLKPFDEDELLVTVENHLKKYYNYKKTVNMTVHDELTGLYNKRAIYSKLTEEFSKREYNDISLIFCDIDHFKEFNDRYGHQLGDRVLAHVGELIKEALRKYDFAGRYGGEEFVIVLANSDESQALNVAYKIRERLRELPLQHEGLALEVRLSYGVAGLKSNGQYLAEQLKIDKMEDIFGQELPFEADELEDMKERLSKLLLKISDDALYSAKRTRCHSCGYRSEKPIDFKDGSCSQCGGKELEQGRDRVMIFRKGTIVPGVLN